MLLMQDRVLGETMMHLVPSCSPHPPTFDASQLDFDLDLLPGFNDCQVPSPSDSLDYPISPTMFSPDPSKDDQHRGYTASPTSSLCPSSPYSPYSPASRMERKVSTASSGLQEVDMSNINLQQSLDEFTQLQEKIKKEQDMALSLDSGLTSPFPSFSGPAASQQTYNLPQAVPSYPDSSSVKIEPLDFLPPKGSTGSHTATSQASNSESSNQLLKQCLQDDSFKTKWDLKPFDFGVTTGFISERSKAAVEQRSVQKKEEEEEETKSEVKIEPVLDLAVEQVKKDIESTCTMLGISSDPKKWKESDVRSWLLWTLQQFSIPMSMLDLDQWNMDGQTMLSLGEQDFQQRLPQGGDTMYAQFDMWRSNAAYHYQPPATCGMAPRYAPPPYPDYGWGPADGSASPHQEAVPAMPPLESTPTNTSSSDTSFSDIAFMLQMLDHQNNPVGDPQTHYITPKVEPSSYPPHQASPPPYPGSEMLSQSPSQASSDFGVDPMEEDEDDEEEEVEATKSSSRPGTNIHLWQFVKELLLQPTLYGNYIHWIDRQKGVFKIVDSVKVATLWGKRKNRPAMNYDKLSRSLRQYYKKGIMKKTERSQRLVYQFCHPYHL